MLEIGGCLFVSVSTILALLKARNRADYGRNRSRDELDPGPDGLEIVVKLLSNKRQNS
jgi:hypothetical protein